MPQKKKEEKKLTLTHFSLAYVRECHCHTKFSTYGASHNWVATRAVAFYRSGSSPSTNLPNRPSLKINSHTFIIHSFLCMSAIQSLSLIQSGTLIIHPLSSWSLHHSFTTTFFLYSLHHPVFVHSSNMPLPFRNILSNNLIHISFNKSLISHSVNLTYSKHPFKLYIWLTLF